MRLFIHLNKTLKASCEQLNLRRRRTFLWSKNFCSVGKRRGYITRNYKLNTFESRWRLNCANRP